MTTHYAYLGKRNSTRTYLGENHFSSLFSSSQTTSPLRIHPNCPTHDVFIIYFIMAETVVTRFTALAKKVTELSQQLNRAAVGIKARSDPIAPYRSCEQEEAGREHPGTLRLRSS